VGLLDNVIGGLAGKALGGGQSAAGGATNPLLQMAMQLISSSGGLDGLLQKFTAAGLGSAASSWVATGPNPPISGEQLVSALGSSQVSQLAQQFGLQPHQAASGLAQVLPAMVDKLTPNGVLDQNHSGPGLEQALAGLLGGGGHSLGLGDLAKLLGR